MRIFIGSSQEGKKYAAFSQAILPAYGLDPMSWMESFPAGVFTLESLYNVLETTDGAIFFITPDDKVWYRGDAQLTARDNLIFEAGLFLAVHGRKRVALIVPSVADPQSGEAWRARLPSDLAGLTYTGFSVPSGKDLAETDLPRVLKSVAEMIVGGPQQPADYGALLTDNRLKQLLKPRGVRFAHAIVAPWSGVSSDIGALMRDPKTKEIDLLVAYRVNEVVRDMRNFRANPKGRMRVCFADMFDRELNAMYRRKYVDRTEDHLRNGVVESIRKVLIGDEYPEDTDKVRSDVTGLVIDQLAHPPQADYRIFLTPQRITFGYYRIDNIAWVIPLDVKVAQGPSPYAWAFAKEQAPDLFDYYLRDEFENVIKQGSRIFPTHH